MNRMAGGLLRGIRRKPWIVTYCTLLFFDLRQVDHIPSRARRLGLGFGSNVIREFWLDRRWR
jgi:hypothetical protein